MAQYFNTVEGGDFLYKVVIMFVYVIIIDREN